MYSINTIKNLISCDNPFKAVISIGLIVLSICTFCIAVLPENSGKLLTSAEGWSVSGVSSNKVPLASFPVQVRHIRNSAVESTGGVVFRTWTPEYGIVPLEISSAPFKPARFMSVAITGASRTQEGGVQAYIECEQNRQRLDIFRGSVNVNLAESIIIPPEGWCSGDARLKFISSEKNVNVGVGSVFEISYLSYLKSSFLGRLPYFLVAITLFSLIMLAGASLATRWVCNLDPLPIAFVSLGVTSLGVFYLSNGMLMTGIPEDWRWTSIAMVIMLVVIALVWSGREARVKSLRALLPYARIWIVPSLGYFAVLNLVSNGVGHWEPNYRFWPAVWSSDNELPWMFAEAIRHGWDFKGLFGGGWLPTDRPPLMAGAHLLLTDFFNLLQSGNDGKYLNGQAYNAVAVTLNALWLPASLWLLRILHKGMNDYARRAILMFIGFQPFVLFNTLYGWPKAFGAAFALVAFGLVWQARAYYLNASSRSVIVLFFMLGAFSMLAHASTAIFLLPLGVWFLYWTLRHNLKSILIGFGIALALLASWSMFKAIILPSSDPLTKYALTGDYGFAYPNRTLWQMLSSLYASLNFWQWLEIKKTILLQALIPLDHSVTQIWLNSDYGASEIDKLRAWDFMLLSKGNLPILIFDVLALWLLMYEIEGKIDAKVAPFYYLMGISILSWFILVVGFIAPSVIPVWPQAALFGLALSGAVIVLDRYPFMFNLGLLVSLTYTGLVWILLPIQTALSIDLGAAFVLSALGSWILITIYTLETPNLGFNIGFSCSNNKISRIFGATKSRMVGNASFWSFALHSITVISLFFVTYITFRYIQQPLVDTHAFRQSQTALTTYWILKEGWQLAYQTPVVGFPWSIPFEFPIYQLLVAAIVTLSGFDLEPVGRFVSYAFLLACAWPTFALSRRLDLPATVPWVFCALFWTSPIYVYWGRTFMIETTALFFSLACMPFAIDLIRRVEVKRSALLYVAFATVGVLQKSTTAGPILLFLVLAAIISYIQKYGLNFLAWRHLVQTISLLCIPLGVGLVWTHYTDFVKMASPFGQELTSKSLSSFTFGNLEQKLSLANWRLVVWERCLGGGFGGCFSVLLLLSPWFGSLKYRRYAWLSLIALLLFGLPILIFTNLHVVHNYYQVACHVFLLGALAIVIGGYLRPVSGILAIVPIATAIIMGLNIADFNSAYGLVASRNLDESDPRTVQAFFVGRYLREHTPPGTGIVIFGQGYSSEIGFQAQRKSLTVDARFQEYKRVWENPKVFLGGLDLSAIVICPLSNEFPNMADLQKKLTQEREWEHVTVNGCELLLSKDTLIAE
jgi:hypothetical protein